MARLVCFVWLLCSGLAWASLPRYTAAGQLQSENGPWSNDTLTYGYTHGQRTSMTLGSLAFGYDHDSAWRLQTLTSPAGTFGYDYRVGQSVSPAPLVRAITLPN